SPTLIVSIDEESLRRLGRWPWSREQLADLIEKIESGKPRVIAVDVLLNDPTSAEADEKLAVSIANSRAVVLAAHIDRVGGNEHWLEPDPLFVQKNVRLVHVHTDPDFDNINRRILSVKVAGNRAIPAFAVEALHTAGLPFKADFEQKIGGAEVFRPRPINIRFVGDNNTFQHVPAWQVLGGAANPS